MAIRSYKTTQFLKALIKLLILGLACYVIVSSWETSQRDPFFHLIKYTDIISSYRNIAILLLLSAINWALESQKWRVALASFVAIPFRESVAQTLTAHLAGIITPVKIGDFTAKALHFPKQHRKKVFFLGFLNSWYQMLATTIAGILGSFYLVVIYFPEFIPLCMMLLFLALLIWNYKPLNKGIVSRGLNSSLYRRWSEIAKTSPSLRRQLLGYSFARYVVFAHQFYLLMVLFEIPLSYATAMSLINGMYLLSSLLPMLQFFDVVVKGSVAVVLFGYFDIAPATMVGITFLMWLFNVVFPLLPASYFFWRFNPQFKLDFK